MTIQLRALGAALIVALVLALALLFGPGVMASGTANAHPTLAKVCPPTVLPC